MRFRPLGDPMAAHPFAEELKSAGGIIVPDTTQEGPSSRSKETPAPLRLRFDELTLI